ncbi:chemotaxis protein CheR [Geomonas sp. Red69]|uniref:chemotaxis protein CheR n=1 Tax=Geomonas diazotrophica TaxID=2843197 RepID=UPI001C111809|nr:chemotaxis protein CheR [Geomonas diazotrophica]MBU5638402.1 chemotaxis protein CheR [Geomonas diazotrophica]
MQLSFVPTIDGAETRLRLERLLVPGSLLDPALERRIARLGGAFESYAAGYPLPLWAPGLAVSNEMRGLTEALFPLEQPRAVFEMVLRRGCRFSPLLSASYLHGSASWIDLLQKLWPLLPCADPAPVLRRLAEDEAERTTFLFALMLPQHFGGGFDRYPVQTRWLSLWLRANAGRFPHGIRVLDAACGSGEGTYQAAQVLADAGFGAGSSVHGSTLEPIELFAAAHMYFPHAAEREREYRGRVGSLLCHPAAPALEFYLDRVDAPLQRAPYDLVLCNGLLGGPLLHDPVELAAAFAGLAARLAPGGLLVAADRFHAGWRQRVPNEELVDRMRACRLTPLEIPEGIAGIKAS